MVKKYIIPFILMLGACSLFAQNIEKYFENQQPVLYEKLYLHTDREFYFEKDTLWFATYLVNGQSHTNTPEACNLYIDLINSKGEIVQNELFIIQNGHTSGHVPLLDSAVAEGNYLLRAYTDYLKNFGDDAFFSKTIRVSAVKSSFDLASDKQVPPVSALPPASAGVSLKPQAPAVPLVKGDSGDRRPDVSGKAETGGNIDVSFLPEGGFLLAGESNCVAFKAIDKKGKGVEISGKLFDEKNNLVLSFNSIYKGAGKFYFYPKTGKTYTARIDGNGAEFQLPVVRETGVKIKLINQDKEIVQMMVYGKSRNSEMPYYLTCMHRGTGLFFTEVSWDKLNSVLKVATNQLGAGINRFVLLNKNLQQVSERLVYNQVSTINELNVQLSEETYSTREEVQLNIRSADQIINDFAQVSVAVVDENYINATGVSQNIASYLLLDSELKGHIDSPASYFKTSDGLNAQTKLDLLMCTNGWSNYIWNFLNPETITPDIQPELGFTFKGNVKRAIGNKALPEGNVSLIVKSDSTTQFLDQEINKNGQFEFNNIVFYDTASVFGQARNKRDKHSIQFKMQFPEIIRPSISTMSLNELKSYSEIPLSVYRQRYLNEMRLWEFNIDKQNILLEEVEIKAKKPKPKFKTGTPWKNNGPYKLTWEMTAGSFDIVEYLAFHVPGIIPYRSAQGELLIKVQAGYDMGPPAFFIDGSQYFSITEIKNFNVSDFSTIEIVTPPMSYSYGARAMFGAVILTFFRGDEVDPTRPLLGGIVERINGFTPLREFYSPNYTPANFNSETPDYRNTLYWNPGVNIMGGEHELFFYTCDNVSRYKIFVEGITQNGTICLGEAKFEVDRFKNSVEDLVPLVSTKATSKLPAPIVPFNKEDRLNLNPNLSGEVKTGGKTISQNTNYQLNSSQQTNQAKIEILPLNAANQSLWKDQITGTVFNKNNEPVEFASLYNLTQKTSGMTNVNGEFKLKAVKGDSVRIQHLNYETKEVVITIPSPRYILDEKEFLIPEVTVSPQAAFDLFNTACENTWFSFKDKNITRAYCRVERKNGSKTSQTIDLDLDIIQKKQNSFKRGEKITTYKIQERIETDTTVFNSKLELILNLFHPLIHQIYWVDLPNQFNYYKAENDENIKLYLISKSTYDQKCNIEVTIQKSDTLLRSFAMVKKDLFTKQKYTYDTDTFHILNTKHFIGYDYSDEFGYLSIYYQSMAVQDPEIPSNIVTVTQHLNTTNNGALDLIKRSQRRRIFRNSFNPILINNRYQYEFWEEQPNHLIPYNFEGLANIKMGEDPKIEVHSESGQNNVGTKAAAPKYSWRQYTMESQQEQIQSIAKKNGVTIDDIFFHPYYMSYGRPVYSNKKYSIQEMLSLQGGSEDLRNKILEVYYSNKNLTKNKYGCKNFACNESRTCIVFPFSNTNKEILANGFAIYLRVRND